MLDVFDSKNNEGKDYLEVNNEEAHENEASPNAVKLSVNPPSLPPKSTNNISNIKNDSKLTSAIKGSALKPNVDDKTKLLSKKDNKDKDGKAKEDEKKEENNEDFENQRTQKLMNSKDNNRKIVIIQFSFIAALFITYFVVDFVMEVGVLDDVRKAYRHLKLVSQRPGIVKNTLVFTLEQVANASVQMQNSLVFTKGKSIDVREYFTNLIYDNERDIFQSMTESYPSTFSGYESLFQDYNYNDLCTKYYQMKEPTKYDRTIKI